MSDAEFFKDRPNPQDPAVRTRLAAIRRRMFKDLSTQLPDDWMHNANAKDRNEFLKHMVTSKTMSAIVDIVSWTMLSIEKEEEAIRARSPQ
jgi:hypothetical protein